MDNTDCPCRYGKNIPLTNPICPICKTDLSILFLINNLSSIYKERGLGLMEKSEYADALKSLRLSCALDPDNKDSEKFMEEIKKKIK